MHLWCSINCNDTINNTLQSFHAREAEHTPWQEQSPQQENPHLLLTETQTLVYANPSSPTYDTKRKKALYQESPQTYRKKAPCKLKLHLTRPKYVAKMFCNQLIDFAVYLPMVNFLLTECVQLCTEVNTYTQKHNNSIKNMLTHIYTHIFVHALTHTSAVTASTQLLRKQESLKQWPAKGPTEPAPKGQLDGFSLIYSWQASLASLTPSLIKSLASCSEMLRCLHSPSTLACITWQQ